MRTLGLLSVLLAVAVVSAEEPTPTESATPLSAAATQGQHITRKSRTVH